MKCIQIHFSHTLQILVHRSQEANAVRCKVVLTIYYFACNLYNWTRRARPSPWPQSTPHLFYRLHHTGFGQWPDSVYSTGLLCCTAIWVWIQKRRQAIKQFPPSESHSDPHRGNWRLTPARQRRPQSQTKSLGRLDIREPNQQIIKTYLKYEGFQWSGKICSPDIVSKMLKASWQKHFVAAIPTMEEDCDCWTDLTVWSLYTNIYFRNS